MISPRKYFLVFLICLLGFQIHGSVHVQKVRISHPTHEYHPTQILSDLYISDKVVKYEISQKQLDDNQQSFSLNIVSESSEISNEKIILNGGGRPISDSVLRSVFSNAKYKISIINAPGTEIKNYNFSNSELEIIHSPNSVISQNLIGNKTSNSSIFAISLFNSSNSIVAANTIYNLSSNSSFAAIQINVSDNVIVRDNNIYNLYSGFYQVPNLNIVEVGISALNGNNITIANNLIHNITTSSGGGIRLMNLSNSLIASNQISAIQNEINLYSDIFGIFSIAGSQISVSDNNLSEIVSTALSSSTTAYGISFLQTNRSKIVGNNLTEITSVSEAPDSYAIHIVYSSNNIVEFNSVAEVLTLSNNPFASFSTGIFVSFSSRIDVHKNALDGIYSKGRGVYGVFVDQSEYLSIKSNTLTNIFGESTKSTSNHGITLRVVPNSIIHNNTLTTFYTQSIDTDIYNSVATITGIFVDSSDNSSISQNLISDLIVSSQYVGADVIGIISVSSDNNSILDNIVADITAGNFADSYAIGIILSSDTNNHILHNQISGVLSYGRGFGIMSIGSANLTVWSNSIQNIVGQSNAIGITISKAKSPVIKNNTIQIVQSGYYEVAVDIQETINAQILSNYIIGSSDINLGIRLHITANTRIEYNYISSAVVWISISETESLICKDNVIRDKLLEECNPLDYLSDFDNAFPISADLILTTTLSEPELGQISSNNNNSSTFIFIAFLGTVGIIVRRIFKSQGRADY